MRIVRLFAMAAVSAGGFGLVGCQGDADTRHAEAGSYDSQRLNAAPPSGSPSTGAGVGIGGSTSVNTTDARQSGARPDVDRSGTIVQPGDTAGGSSGTANVAGARQNAADAGNTSDTTTGAASDRAAGSERRVPNLEPGDRGAGPGVRGTSGPGLSNDGIKRGSGGGGNDTRD